MVASDSSAKSHRSFVRLLVSFTMGVLLLGGLFRWIGVDRLLAAMRRASPLWLAFSALTFLPAYFLRALRWKFLLLPVKNPVRVSHAFWATSVGSMINTFIPVRLGEFAKAYILGEKEQIGFAPSFSSVVVEHTLDLVGLLTIGLITMLILPVETDLPSWILDGFAAIGVLIGVILATIVFGVKRESAVLKLLSKVSDSIKFLSRRGEKIVGFARSSIDGLKGISQNPRILTVNMTLTWVLWLIYCLTVYFVFKAFSHPISAVTVILGGVLLNLTYLLPASPGYVGTYEAYWTLIFMSLGTSQTDLILAMGVTSHLLVIAATIALGCTGVVWLGMSFRDVFRTIR